MKPLRIMSCAGKARAAALTAAGACAVTALLIGSGPARALADTVPQAGPSQPGPVPTAPVPPGPVPTAPVPPGPVPTVPVPPVPGQPDSLLVTVRDSASSPPLSWSLTCYPDGGTHPNPVLACDQLSSAGDPFSPVPVGVMCSMIYYGPQTATITGYWQGQPVSAQFSRVNGCEEQRWEKIATVLVIPVPPVPANPGGPLRPAQASPPRTAGG